MRAWVTPEDHPPFRPYLTLLLDITNHFILGQDITRAAPDIEAIYAVVEAAIQKRPPRTGKARRPRAILVESPELAEALRPTLDQLDIACTVEAMPFVDEILKEVEAYMNEGHTEPPGLLEIAGVTPEYAAHLFAAAAQFYRAEPWFAFVGDVPLAIRLTPGDGTEFYASVIGGMGTEYGLTLYRDWDDFLKLYLQEGNSPLDFLSEKGYATLMFGDISLLPISDSEALEQLGWEVADEDAYPLFIEFHRGSDTMRRPTRETLEWIEAALLAIPKIADDVSKAPLESDAQPFAVKLTLDMFSGKREAEVRCPAGELPIEQRSIVRWDDLEDDEEDDEAAELPEYDPRMTEGLMAQLLHDMGIEPTITDESLQQAQQLIDKAFKSPSAAHRIALAHKALSLSPNCADAWVLLAEEEADTLGQQLAYYRQGIEAGERALGQAFFDRYEGAFWKVLETRPYMRARYGAILTLIELERMDQAIAECHEMLRLNPDDNQGVRHILLTALVSSGRDQQAMELLKQYADDTSPEWLYTRALLTFRQHGESKPADKLLRAAVESNPHVPAYLSGVARIPPNPPDYVTVGGEDEAAAYARMFLHHWRRTPDAIEWLKRLTTK